MKLNRGLLPEPLRPIFHPIFMRATMDTLGQIGGGSPQTVPAIAAWTGNSEARTGTGISIWQDGRP
jgi:hypothetical protein